MADEREDHSAVGSRCLSSVHEGRGCWFVFFPPRHYQLVVLNIVLSTVQET